MEIIKERTTTCVERYFLAYQSTTDPSDSYWFPCDKSGNILEQEMSLTTYESLKACQTSHYSLEGVKDSGYDYTEPAVGRCTCGRSVELANVMTNECECGHLSNGCGQALVPRSQWEEPWDEDHPEIPYGVLGNDW